MQRRDDFGEPRENFNRDWHDYKYGFGNPDQEVWLGNENVYLLTDAEDHELRIELADYEGNIRYFNFHISIPMFLLLLNIIFIMIYEILLMLNLDMHIMNISNLEMRQTISVWTLEVIMAMLVTH